MIKLLIGGSPCTYWSVAQKKGREVEAEGLGWELFKNYLIALEKFKPDLFLYENNKSAAQPIKEQISRELGVDLMYINSALVSAQNRQRFYAFNWKVSQPEDRRVYLKDILESPEDVTEKGYALAAPIPVNVTVDGKAQCLRACSYKDGIRNLVANTVDRRTCVAEPVRIGTIENEAKKQSHDSKQYRVYSTEGKATTLCGEGGGLGAKTGLYACQIEKAQGVAWRGRDGGSAFEVRDDGKANALTASGHQSRMVAQAPDGKTKPVYEVINGEIEIKGKKYPIKLPDGFYIIRKLTPTECERLQTLPDGYTAAVSNTQRYRGLGNGWTAEVIIHILTGALKDVPRDEEIVVLSMYDGIGTGRYCLEKMGFTNITYYAYEIDEPAMKVALSNYPDIIQCGDAFDLRRDDWAIGKRFDKNAQEQALTDGKVESHDQKPPLEGTDEQEHDQQKPQEDQPTPVDFDVVTQLGQLLTERRRLSTIADENPRYSLDVRALEYAIRVLEVVT